jgi:hypothetical protein
MRQAGRKKDEPEAGERAIEIFFSDSRTGERLPRNMPQIGAPERICPVGFKHRLKLRLDFIFNNGQGGILIGSALHCVDQAPFAAPHSDAVHHVHDSVDDSPGQIAANGSGKQLRSAAGALCLERVSRRVRNQRQLCRYPRGSIRRRRPQYSESGPPSVFVPVHERL